MPLQRRVDIDSTEYILNLKGMTTNEHTYSGKCFIQALKHAQKTLWLTGKATAPDRLKRARTGKFTRNLWRKKVEDDWNHRPENENEGLRSRTMPKAKMKTEPALWAARSLGK